MSETPKKLTRVSFVGVSNLPPQKAAELGAALQRIVAATAEAHNACDDARMDIDATFKHLRSLGELREVVARVAVLASEEAALGAPTLRAELDALAQTIARHADSLLRGFDAYEEHHPQRGALASGIFQSLLNLAQETVDLLRVSDSGTCARLAALVASARSVAQEIRNASSTAQLQEASYNLRETSSMISKRFQRRAELFDDPSFEKKVSLTTNALEEALSALVDRKQTSLNSNNVPISTDNISSVFNVLDEMAMRSPEFSVIMEVEYFENRTELDIAALLEACMKGDKESIVRLTRDLASKIQAAIQDAQRVAPSLPSPEKEKVLKACDDANAAMMDIVKTSKQLLEADSSLITRNNLAQQQANAARRLRQALASLPTRDPLVLVRDKRRLQEAARGLMLDFASIVSSLSPSSSSPSSRLSPYQ